MIHNSLCFLAVGCCCHSIKKILKMALITYVLALVLAVNSAVALKCYKCDSSDNPLCSYGITSITYNSVDCDTEVGGVFSSILPKQCVKFVATDNDGKEYIARNCMPGIGGSCDVITKGLNLFSKVDGGVKNIQCSSCDTDNCNSAEKFTGWAFLGVLLASLVFMF